MDHVAQAPVSGTTSRVSGHLVSVDEAARIIRSGNAVSIAGDERALRQLPKGMWIGGTIPYFMAEMGGECSQDKVFVNELPLASRAPGVCHYDAQSIEEICRDAPSNGFTVLIVPAFSQVHERFAHDAPEFENMYLQPLIGWISGVHLEELAEKKPLVVFGPTGEFFEDKAVAMHVDIDDERSASIEIVNLFSPGNGDVIRFPESGFSATEAEVNGEKVNFAQYLRNKQVDTRLPLVADYLGAHINVSFQSVADDNGKVTFYAPVFSEHEYRIADSVPAYADAFAQVVPNDEGEIAFCCNCILNYLYGELEGKHTGRMYGPMTFGEIAYQLVNQTMAYLRIT